MKEKVRNSGIWKGRKIKDSGWFGKDGGIAFFCDRAVVKVWLKRVPSK